MKLCDYRNVIIKLFKDKNIQPCDYACNAKAEELEEKSESESELKSESEPDSLFKKGIAERTKIRREKSNEENEKGQGLKIPTPDQMFSVLPISLAQLKSGNYP